MGRRLEIAANVALICLCILFGAQAILSLRRPVAAAQTTRPEIPTYKTGDTIRVRGLDFSNAQRNVLLVVRKDCRFCEASMPFYKDLATLARSQPGNRVIAVSSDADAVSRANFRQHGVELEHFVQISFGELKVGGTPTAILVNDKAVVQRLWTGQMNDSAQLDLEAELRKQ